MQAFDAAALLLFLVALFGYVNYKFVKLPFTIGLMVITLGCSVVVLTFDVIQGALGLFPSLSLRNSIGLWVGGLDFSTTFMHVMLGYLLFAGSLHVNLDDLFSRKWAIGSLATVGVAISTALVGGLCYFLFGWMGYDVPVLFCFIFGALISPTDPVAVLGVLKRAGATKSLEAKIAGESLFNDGVGVVVFIVLTALAVGSGGHGAMGVDDVALLFLQEAVGGALFGLLAGYVAYQAMKSIDNYHLEVILTLALVTVTYSLAGALHMSGLIAVVVAGLMIGNHGRRFAMSDTTVDRLENFWSLVDEILNALLFLLLGLEIFAISLNLSPLMLLIGAVAIPVVLGARFISVSIPITVLKRRREFTPGVIKILTWCGLRGGISVALVLSLPEFAGRPDFTAAHRDLLVTSTYVVVVFSIIVQGLTIPLLFKGGKGDAAGPAHD